MVLSTSQISAWIGDQRVATGSVENGIEPLRAEAAKLVSSGDTAAIQRNAIAQAQLEGRIEGRDEMIENFEDFVEAHGGMVASARDHVGRSSRWAGPRGGKAASKLPNLYSPDAGGMVKGAAASSGPRLSVYSPSTGKQFIAIRKGEPVAQEQCGSLTVGDYVLASVNGSWDHIPDVEDRGLAVELAQSTLTVAGGAVLVPDNIWGQHIDAIRDRTKVFQAGLQTVFVDDIPSGSISITETTGGPTGYWLPELGAGTSSAITFKLNTLFHRKLMFLVPCSRELLADSANARQAITEAILSANAAAIDYGVLFGAGTGSELTGVVNHGSIQSVASVGTPTDYAELITALQSIYTAGFDQPGSNLAWLYSPREMASYGALVDTTNQPLNEPRLVSEMQHYVASALPITDGDGGNESTMVIGPFDQAIMFIKQRPQIEVLREGQLTDTDSETLNLITQDALVLRCTMRCALAIIRPTWFAKLTGVTSA